MLKPEPTICSQTSASGSSDCSGDLRRLTYHGFILGFLQIYCPFLNDIDLILHSIQFFRRSCLINGNVGISISATLLRVPANIFAAK